MWVNMNAVRIPRVNKSICRPRTLKYTTENNTYTITRYFFSVLFCTICFTYFVLFIFTYTCHGVWGGVVEGKKKNKFTQLNAVGEELIAKTTATF